MLTVVAHARSVVEKERAANLIKTVLESWGVVRRASAQTHHVPMVSKMGENGEWTVVKCATSLANKVLTVKRIRIAKLHVARRTNVRELHAMMEYRMAEKLL